MCMWQTILAVCGGISALAAGLVGLKKLLEPVLSLRKDIKTLQEHQASDYVEIKAIKETRQHELEKSRQFRRVTYEAMLALINHELDGNGLEGMKASRNALQKHILEDEV